MVEIKEIEELEKLTINPDQFPRPSWADEDKSVDELMQETPLFMTEMKDGYTNTALEALQAMKYDGTPEENADNFKNQGNEMLAYKPPRRQDAINYYTEAIQQNCSDNKLNSVCYCNRAAVNLELKNYRKVINDCVKALEFDPENIKAFYRASRALYALDKVNESIECCEAGLKLSPDNAALKLQLEKSKQLSERLENKKHEAESRLKAEEEKKEVLQKAIQERNIQFRDRDDKMYEPDLESDSSVKYDIENDQLLWPVFFLYPEFKESDFIESCGDRTTFLDHIQVMFEQPAPWDPEFNYDPSSIEVYFESFPKNATKPSLVKVGKKLEIGKILSHPKYFVVNGVPSFIILSSKSKFKDEFLNRYKQNV